MPTGNGQKLGSARYLTHSGNNYFNFPCSTSTNGFVDVKHDFPYFKDAVAGIPLFRVG